MVNKSKDVTQLLDDQNHPFRKEIESLRNFILATHSDLAENIKWNGPNYCFNNEDRITMRINPPAKQVQLIFHRGAKKLEQPKEKLLATKSKLLTWKENDRAIATFKSSEDIENSKAELAEIIIDWITATK